MSSNEKSKCQGTKVKTCYWDAEYGTDGSSCGQFFQKTNDGFRQCVPHFLGKEKVQHCMQAGWHPDNSLTPGLTCSYSKASEMFSTTNIGLGIAILIVIGGAYYYYNSEQGGASPSTTAQV